jgi:hypothetical protein
VHTTDREKSEIRAYVEAQAHEEVVHLEKAASELVGPVRHVIWDVQCPTSRWWVVTNPTNLYDQSDFKSRDVVLTFHIGLALRVEYAREREVPLAPETADLLPGSWRRWQQAFEAYESGTRQRTFSRSASAYGNACSLLLGRRAHRTSCLLMRSRPKRPTSRPGLNCWLATWRPEIPLPISAPT